MKIVEYLDGFIAKELEFDINKTKKETSWQGRWIWLDDEAYPEYQKSIYTVFCDRKGKKPCVAIFRKQVKLVKEIKNIKLWISADTKYRLYINGKMVGRGPAEVGGDYGNEEPLHYWFYDGYELTDYFYAGDNVIVVEVLLQPQVQADYSMGHGGMLLEAVVDYKDDTREIIKSDESFKGFLNSAFLDYNIYSFQKEQKGIHDNDFDDNNYKYAKFTENIWELIPKEIPHLVEGIVKFKNIIVPFEQYKGRVEEKDGKVILTPGSHISFWLDFGKVYSGFTFFKVEGEKGIKLEISSQEMPGRDEFTERFYLDDGEFEYRSMRLQSIRFLQINLGTFTKPVVITPKVIFSFYPVDYAGDFECSDKLLNRVYRAGRWTNQICRQSYHLDSPVHQEALGCTGDYYIQSLMNYYTFGDKWLTRLDILRTASLIKQKDGVMFHTSYSLLWIEMLIDYYKYTGDDTIILQTRNEVFLLLKIFASYVGKSGLVDNAPNYMFMDWVLVGSHNLHHPPKAMGVSYMTALYYKALLNGAYICELLCDFGGIIEYTKTAAYIKESFNNELYVEGKGLYCDGKNGYIPSIAGDFMPEDVEGIYFSQHTNSLAVLFDLAPVGIQRSIMEKVVNDKELIQAQPYFMHFVLNAIHHAGLFDKYGNEQMRRWGKLLSENKDSLKEVWDGFECDYSHAWSGTPTYQMPSKTLGIIPVEAGFKKVAINPCISDLKWARGKVPTPFGIIEISAERNNNGVIINAIVPKQIEVISSNIPDLVWILKHKT